MVGYKIGQRAGWVAVVVQGNDDIARRRAATQKPYILIAESRRLKGVGSITHASVDISAQEKWCTGRRYRTTRSDERCGISSTTISSSHGGGSQAARNSRKPFSRFDATTTVVFKTTSHHAHSYVPPLQRSACLIPPAIGSSRPASAGCSVSTSSSQNPRSSAALSIRFCHPRLRSMSRRDHLRARVR